MSMQPSLLSTPPTILGVIGDPIAHSVSPRMHTAALKHLEMNAVYHAFRVSTDRLKDAVLGAQALGFLGLNVTLPHKEHTLRLCMPDGIAHAVGAVNTLRFTKDEVYGTSTDVIGFSRMCDDEGIELSPHQRVVILGAGGASRSIIAALFMNQVPCTVFSRSPKTLWVCQTKISCLPLTEEAISPHLKDCSLIIDATPRGIQTIDHRIPLSESYLTNYPELRLDRVSRRTVLIDISVSNETLLSAMAKQHHLRCVLGHGMLVHQGAAALSFWLQKEIPQHLIEVMRTAITAH